MTTLVVGSAWAQPPVAAPASGDTPPPAPEPAPPVAAPPAAAPPLAAPPSPAPVPAPPVTGQPPPGYPGMVQLVPVTFRGTVEPILIELYHPLAQPGLDAPIARCQVPCRAQIPVGRYKLYVTSSDTTLSGSRIVDIFGPATVMLDPDAPSQRSTGLVLGIGGVVAFFGGALLLLANSFEECDDCGGSGTDRSSARVLGGTLLLGGLVATPIGWTMFGRSFKPEVSQSLGAQMGLAPTLFPSPRGVAGEHAPGLVFQGRF